MFPSSDRQTLEGDVHDANPVQRDHPVAKRLTHPSDLPVAPLCQDNAEFSLPTPADDAGSRALAEDDHAATHSVEKDLVERPVELHEVLFLMPMFGPQD